MLSLPPHEKVVVEALRGIVFDCIPNVREKLSYNVPFYSRHRRICLIWPSSVPWGKVRSGGVEFGFCEGHRLRDEAKWLERGTRKQVFMKTFHKPEEIEQDLLRAYLMEAVEVDDTFVPKR